MCFSPDPDSPARELSPAPWTRGAALLAAFLMATPWLHAAPEIAIEDLEGRTLESGRVVAWGRDNYNQTTVPEDLKYGVKQIAMGDRHTMALKTDGTLKPWGQGANKEPTVPEGIGPVTAIAAGIAYNVAIKQDGSLKAWGSSFQGQTNVPSVTNAQAVSAGVNHGIVLLASGIVLGWGNGYPAMQPTSFNSTDVKAISAGYYHNLSLKTNGTVACWASTNHTYNFPYSYTVPGLTDITAVSAGKDFSLALKADGTVWYWTHLATPVKVPVTGATAISAGGTHYAVLRNDGTMVTFGGNTYGQATVPASLDSVSAIKAGDVNTMAIITSRLDFGDQASGTVGPSRTLLVRNKGEEPLHISGVTLVSGNISDYVVDTTGMLTTVPAGGQTAFKVSFSPSSSSLSTATLRVANDDSDESSHDIILAGNTLPEISVFAGATTTAEELTDQVFTASFPDSITGSTRTFTILNTRDGPLTGLSLAVSGAHASDFTGSHPLATTLYKGESTTFTVAFSPKASGPREATLSIVSNDADENPFRINLSGTSTGLTPLETWRQTYFNDSSDGGERTLTADFDKDGMSNLLEYALGTNPAIPTPPDARPQGGMLSGTFTLTYHRPAGGVPGVAYDVQMAQPGMSGWTSAISGTDYTQTISPNGDGSEKVVITFDSLSGNQRFARISVAY